MSSIPVVFNLVLIRISHYFHDLEKHKCNWSEEVDWRVGEYVYVVIFGFPCSILAKLGDEMGFWIDCESLCIYSSIGNRPFLEDSDTAFQFYGKTSSINFCPAVTPAGPASGLERSEERDGCRSYKLRCQ